MGVKSRDDEDPFEWLVFCPSCGAYTEPGPDGKPTCNHGHEHAPASPLAPLPKRWFQCEG